jgi:lysophospholipase L1-like esterase
MNQARANVGDSGEVFPEYPQILQTQMQDILMTAQQRYPQLKQAFLSNRIYAGYALTPLNPEPYAYETGFAIKWLIEAQLNGDPGFNYDPGNGSVVMPWLSWGPDVWADGLTPRSDGLTWECADYTWDGTHPSDVGSEKVGQMLLEFFKTDSVTGWFLASPAD